MLTIRIKPSKWLAFLLGMAHVGAIGLLLPLTIPVWVKAALSAALLASMVFYIRRHAWLSLPQSIVAVEIHDDCACVIETRQGARLDCELLGSSFVSPYLTVLNLKPKAGRIARNVVILPDAVDAGDFRQLRVLLRWKCGGKRDSAM